jgi:type VI secretion system secreted protein Hcp
MAAVDYFLKLDAIDGESKDAAFTKNIDVMSWSWGQTNGGSMASGTGGGGVGKVQMQDLHVVAAMNTSSAKLIQACAGGTHIPTAVLTCREAGETPQVFMKITLTDVLVSSYQTGGSGHSEVRPTDQFSLNFAKIKYEYGAQDSKTGKVSSLDQKAGYDLKANHKI